MEDNVNKIDVVNVRLVEEPSLFSEQEIHSSDDIVNLMAKELSQYDREVFKSSILSNAAYLIALHNHPSGSVKPSRSDYDTTKRLYDCGRILDMPVVDHIIVGENGNRKYSFAEHGVLGKSYQEVKMERRDSER